MIYLRNLYFSPLSMHYIWEKHFRASVINFLRFGLLETSKTFYVEFLMLRDSKHTWFLFSGSTCPNQKSKGKETLNFKKSKWIQVEEILLYEVPPFHCLILRAYSYLEKFITWQNKSIHSPPGCKPNQTILFNYRWIIPPLNFLQITSASFCFLTDGRWWMKTF